jgi:hypothetical protein
LLTILGRQADDNMPDLIGNFTGSWNLPALYLDAWKDSFPTKDPTDALAGSIDQDIARKLKTLTDLCRVTGRNPCIDETCQVYLPAASQRSLPKDTRMRSSVTQSGCTRAKGIDPFWFRSTWHRIVAARVRRRIRPEREVEGRVP